MHPPEEEIEIKTTGCLHNHNSQKQTKILFLDNLFSAAEKGRGRGD